MLHWLRDEDAVAIDRLRLVADKLLAMSTFGAVARLWWVATGYVDYVKHNELHNRAVHGRIFRGVDDLLRNLVQRGESALVRDPGEELIKIMLFYTGVGETRTERMNEIVEAFSLQNYFPALQDLSESIDYDKIQSQLEEFRQSTELPLPFIRQLVTKYFEHEQVDGSALLEIVEQMEILSKPFEKADIEVVSPLVIESLEVVKGLRNGSIESTEDTGFHLAAAIIFVESGFSGVEQVDEQWVQNGQLKLAALQAINNHQQVSDDIDREHLTGSERQALLVVIGTEVEENLKDIVARLESFSIAPDEPQALAGIDGKIRQIRGALQVLGEQKMGLLLQMSEDQFIALQKGEIESSPQLVDALAVAIGTMEEYVNGLQSGRQGMDHLLDRSITDLEVAIGKKVTRADVAELLENSSDSLFSWLADQSDFSLFTNLKSNLRDLLTLARKTRLTEVEELVKEQERLVDVISQEPAFLTNNITTSLQNNMAGITEHIIQLYGTEETLEELESEAALAYKNSEIKSDDADLRFHDDMDIEELGEPISQSAEDTLSSTEIGKQHAADHQQAPLVDDVIFDVFVEESAQVLGDAGKHFASCQQDLNQRESIRELRRAFHTLKGSARMVELNGIGELAWFSESLFNYVLDTGKPLTTSILEFAGDVLDEVGLHLDEQYKNQHLIDTSAWGARTETLVLEETAAESTADSDSTEPVVNDETLLQEVEGDGKHRFDESQDTQSDSESLLLTDSVLNAANESAEAESHTAEEEIETDSTSFSVIDDQQMREVFVQEAKSNLGIIGEQLARDKLLVDEDDPLSRSVHTLFGNARTLGLEEIAEAFGKAERICQQKQQSGEEMSSIERVVLSDLLTLTHNCVKEVKNEAPYFPIEASDWEKIDHDLQLVLDQELSFDGEQAGAGSIEDSDGGDEPEESYIEMDFDEHMFTTSFQDQDSGDIVFESAASESEVDAQMLDLDLSSESELELASDEDPQLVGESSNELNEKQAVARVAAVFDDLDSIDDLMEEEKSSSIAPQENNANDELANIEQSLTSMRSEETVSDIDSAEPLSQKVNSGDNESAEAEPPKSLIPDELTNLIEDDLLTLESAIQSLGSEDSRSEAEIKEHSPENPQVPEVGAQASVKLDSVSEQEILTKDSAPEEEQDQAQLMEPDRAEEADVSVGEPGPNAVLEVDAAVKQAEDHDVSNELRRIFLGEIKKLHTELDEEVAKLVDLQGTPPALASIMRYLHTIKGSSLMVDASGLGELTHRTESYLEGNFIHNEDELREVRKTLELYVDAIDKASDAYGSGESFSASPELLLRLGEIEDTNVSVTMATMEEEPGESSKEIERDAEIAETLTSVADEIAPIMQRWKSARGWSKLRPDMLEKLKDLENLTDRSGKLEPIAAFISDSKNYLQDLSPKTAAEFRRSKALLEEAFDVIQTSGKALLEGKTAEDILDIQQHFSSDTAPSGGKTTSTEKTTKGRTQNPLDKAVTVEPSIFVPGTSQIDDTERQDVARQQKGARKRAAALRIRTDTLDSLTNYVGDASMNRSQMREDVLSIKSVIDGLYQNVSRFSKQLRELEIEADSKISSRSGESVSKDRGDEFDPLEMDRYTKLQQLSRGLAENLDELGGIQTSLSNFVYKAETSLQKQDRLNRELQDEIMQVRLVSFGGIGPQLRQVVRRTARELDKDVELELIGSGVRLDKTILDGIVPALEHMLRNAVDHGIEAPEKRADKKKPKTGKIVVECRQVAREITINVRDDGVGLDLEKIRTKAIEDSMLADDQPFNPEDMLMYISQSGFSTASKLTQISGRGLGMDVVQATLRRMSGSISYDLENDEPGSSFTLRLPISLAVSNAMFIESGGEQFALAARTIERVINVQCKELVSKLEDDKSIINVDGQDYLLIDLADYLGYESKLSVMDKNVPVILVNAGVQNIAVIIDRLLDTQEIVVKSLGEHLGRIRIYAGATIRADGKVVLVIDLVGISYYESFIALPELRASVTHAIPNVMVVDDSLTVRKSAERDITALGINAVLAKDGLDAQSQLQQNIPDMILLDIEMPRMDGFELLEWVKSEDSLRHIPVVIISSRATDKHITKATRLGCSAFLGKPYLMENLVALFNQHLQLDTPITID